MDVDKVVKLICESGDRLAAALESSRRDEKWWAFMEKEFWILSKLAWTLRGVILKRGHETEELCPGLNDLVKKQVKEILEDSDGE